MYFQGTSKEAGPVIIPLPVCQPFIVLSSSEVVVSSPLLRLRKSGRNAHTFESCPPVVTTDFPKDSVGLKKFISLQPSRSEAIQAFPLSLKINENISPRAVVRYGIQVEKEGGDMLLFPTGPKFQSFQRVVNLTKDKDLQVFFA